MDVKTVCLGMLTDGDASGYDLKKHFESSFGHFFAAGYGSIYPALASLAADGLVSCECIPQDGKPDRKVYSITPAGRDVLLAELDKPNPSHKIRSEFLATICFAHLMSADQVATVLRNRIAEIEAYEKLFDEFEQTCMHETPHGMHFTVGIGRAVMLAMKKYIQENGHELQHRSATVVNF
ncbi:MAG: PadR family transcriptional regulator [Gammaproteobacteria bacterium]|nr:PadR family transcriptional regulator [Gammaproteobacteria bacterium]MDH5304987.1 PadR family transcriptional regulator [Gammaproteobacteria bacterium]MDH5323506.1 PadR family transcriptional regulator [Gammaproteobacteria bacterium]